MLQNFFSPSYNQRNDAWSGSLEERKEFQLAVVREVKRVIADRIKQPFLLDSRISPEGRDEGGYRLPDMLAFVDVLISESIQIAIEGLHWLGA